MARKLKSKTIVGSATQIDDLFAQWVDQAKPDIAHFSIAATSQNNGYPLVVATIIYYDYPEGV